MARRRSYVGFRLPFTSIHMCCGLHSRSSAVWVPERLCNPISRGRLSAKFAYPSVKVGKRPIAYFRLPLRKAPGAVGDLERPDSGLGAPFSEGLAQAVGVLLLEHLPAR